MKTGKKSLLQSLITEYETFRDAAKEESAEDKTAFVRFLSDRWSSSREELRGESSFDSAESKEKALLLVRMQRDIEKAIGRLPRYAELYSKKALAGSPLRNANEFVYLAHLFQRGSMHKSELITENVQEITTGTDIIKRLLSRKLAEQYQDPEDGRKKRLRITEEGRNALLSVMPKMQEASRIVKAHLSDDELLRLAELLKKLDDFHFEIYCRSKEEGLEEIIRTYL